MELSDNRSALASLQEEIPQRIVSSQRLSQLRLAMKLQHASTDSLRFKQQARSKVGLIRTLTRAPTPTPTLNPIQGGADARAPLDLPSPSPAPAPSPYPRWG